MSLLVAKEVFFSALSTLEFASKAGFRRVDTIADSDNDFIVQCRWYISYFWCQMFLFLSRKVCKIRNNCIMVVYSTMGYFEVRDGPEEAVHSLWWEAKTQSIREALFRNLFVTANEMYKHQHCSIPTFPIFWNKCMFVCDFSPLTFCETFRYSEQQKTKDPLCHLLRLPCLELLVILSQVLVLR